MRSLSPGDIFDQRYRLEAILGEGGFAVVWLATEQTSGRRLALKLLKPELPTGYATRTRARFEREVQILARLRDPHTVRLFTHGECDGTLYLVFEYVAGRDLTDLLAERGRFEPDEVMHIVRQVLASLREAHDAGLVHRDLKPANIRITEGENDPLAVRVLDFGIARATDDSHPSITKTGELVGTPRYMSPEQLTNQPLTPASDIYSLGMIAFELLAGAQALRGPRIGDQLERLRSGHLFSAPELERVGVLHAVIQKMTARQVDDRFPSAAAVLSALDSPPTPRLAAPDASSRPDVARTSDPRSHTRTFGIVGLGLAGLALLMFAASFVADEIKRPKSSSSDETAHNVPTALLESETPETPDLGVTDLIVATVPDLDPPADLEEPGDAHTRRFATTGCGRQPDFQGTGPIDGVLTYLPNDYDPDFPHPTVILLHPDYVLPEKMLAASGFAGFADRDRAVVLVPASGGELAHLAWRGEEENERVRQIYDHVSTSLCLDRARTYLVGHGAGGNVAQPLSCDPWVTATAIHAYSPTIKSGRIHRKICEVPKPTIWLYPMKSPYLTNDGSKNCNNNRHMSIDQLSELLRARNDCHGPSIDRFDHAGSTCRRWSCDSPLEICRINGGGSWPGTDIPALRGIADALRQLKGARDPCGQDPEPDFPVGERIWSFLMSAPPLPEPVDPL